MQELTAENVLNSKLLEYLERLEAGAERAGEFVMAEAPATAQEYLHWVFVDAAMDVVFCCIALLATAAMFCIARKGRELAGAFEKGVLEILIVVMLFISLVPASILWGGVRNMVKVSVAPRVVLLEKLSELR